MTEPLQDSLVRLLRYQRAPVRATTRFQGWKHNSILLPRLQEKLEMFLDSYGKHREVVYDTQGIRDDGTDLILRVHAVKADTVEIVGFQVKSFDDLQKPRYMQELKAQRDDAFRKVLGLEYYFIVLCTNLIEHREKMRNIMAEFRSADRTEVIEPTFAYTFLNHPKTRVDALVKRSMEGDDLVFRLAIESVEFPSPSARALAAFLVVQFALTGQARFSTTSLLESPPLRNIYDELRERQRDLLNDIEIYEDVAAEAWDEEEPVQIDDFELQLSADLALLDNDVLEMDSNTEEGRLRAEQLRALIAIVSDALARYDYDEDELRRYMFTLLGVTV